MMPDHNVRLWPLDYFVSLLGEMSRYLRIFSSIIWPGYGQSRDKQSLDSHDCESQSDGDNDNASVAAFASCYSIIEGNTDNQDEVTVETETESWQSERQMSNSVQSSNDDAMADLSTVVNFDEHELLSREEESESSHVSDSVSDGASSDSDIYNIEGLFMSGSASSQGAYMDDVKETSDDSDNSQDSSSFSEDIEALPAVGNSYDSIPEWDSSQLSDESDSADEYLNEQRTALNISPIHSSLSDECIRVTSNAPPSGVSPPSRTISLRKTRRHHPGDKYRPKVGPTNLRQIMEATNGDTCESPMKTYYGYHGHKEEVVMKQKCTFTLETYNSLAGCKILSANSGRFNVTYPNNLTPSDRRFMDDCTKANLTEPNLPTDPHFDLSCLFGCNQQTFMYEAPKGVFELPAYRMDDQIVPQQGRRGKMSQFQTETRKIKRRGTPNKHLVQKETNSLLNDTKIDVFGNPRKSELIRDSDEVDVQRCVRKCTNSPHFDRRHYNVIPIEVILRKRPGESVDDDNKSRTKRKNRKKKQPKKVVTREDADCLEIRNFLLRSGGVNSDGEEE